jgi:hypothetical protein
MKASLRHRRGGYLGGQGRHAFTGRRMSMVHASTYTHLTAGWRGDALAKRMHAGLVIER